MKKLLTFLSILAAIIICTPVVAFAQDATTACAAVPTATKTVDGIPDGKTQCAKDYATCVTSGANQDSCSSYARQEGTSWNAYATCFDPNTPSDSCNTNLSAAGSANTSLQNIVDVANETRQNLLLNNQLPQVTPTPSASNPFINPDGSLNYTPLEPLPFEPANPGSNFSQLLNAILHILVIAGAFLAVGSIVFAGVEYMFTDVVHAKSEARGRAKNALWGLVLLLGAYVILNTINPQLLSFSNIFNPVQSLPGGAVPNSTPTAATPLSATQLQTAQNTCSQTGGTYNASSGLCM